MMDSSVQFVTVCSQGLRLCRAVQCPPSAIARREVRWWREAPRQTQTHQLLKQPFLCPAVLLLLVQTLSLGMVTRHVITAVRTGLNATLGGFRSRRCSLGSNASVKLGSQLLLRTTNE